MPNFEGNCELQECDFGAQCLSSGIDPAMLEDACDESRAILLVSDGEVCATETRSRVMGAAQFMATLHKATARIASRRGGF